MNRILLKTRYWLSAIIAEQLISLTQIHALQWEQSSLVPTQNSPCLEVFVVLGEHIVSFVTIRLLKMAYLCAGHSFWLQLCFFPCIKNLNVGPRTCGWFLQHSLKQFRRFFMFKWAYVTLIISMFVLHPSTDQLLVDHWQLNSIKNFVVTALLTEQS